MSPTRPVFFFGGEMIRTHALSTAFPHVCVSSQDGESNLKIKKPLDIKDALMDDPLNIPKLRGVLQVELPSQNLHHLKATFHLKSGAQCCVIGLTPYML